LKSKEWTENKEKTERNEETKSEEEGEKRGGWNLRALYSVFV